MTAQQQAQQLSADTRATLGRMRAALTGTSSATLGGGQPDDPARRRWFGWDMPTMADAVGSPLLPIVLVAQVRPGDPPLPQPEPVSVDFPNDHLQYALTWYGLAAALAAVYLASSLRKPDGASP